MADEKAGVIILHKYRTALEKLNRTQQGEILIASLDYDATGIMPVFNDPLIEIVFLMMKSDFDAMKENWKKKVKAKSEAGKKGMEERWNKKEEPITDDNKTDSVITHITDDNKKDSVITHITDDNKKDSVITDDNRNNYNDYDYDCVNEYESELNNCGPTEPLPAKIKPEKLPAKIQEKDTLYASLWDSFTAITPKFADYKKEGASTKGLCKKIRDFEKNNPEQFAKEVLETYLNLIRGTDKFWKSQPFTPSGLNSAAIFDRVVKKMINTQEMFNDFDQSALDEALNAMGSSRK